MLHLFYYSFFLIVYFVIFILFCFVILILLLVQQPPTRKIGSIADYDPLNDNYGSLGSGFRSAGGHRDVSNMYTGRFVHEFNTVTDTTCLLTMYFTHL